MKKSPLVSIFLIVAVDIMGFALILPLLPFYAEHFGATPFWIGILLSTYGLCQFIAGPVLGQISDRFGRKPVLLVSQFGTLIGFLILAFTNSLALIFVSRIIDGLTAGNISIAQAYIADVTEPKNRAKSFALIGIAFGLGFMIGPAFSGFLAHYGLHYPIFLAAGLSALSIAATSFLLPDEDPSKRTHSEEPAFSLKACLQAFQNPALAPLLWQFFAFIISFITMMSGFALFAERRFMAGGVPFTAKEVGYVFAYTGLVGLLIQGGLVGRLVHRFGEKKMVESGFLFMVLGFVMLGRAYSIPWLLISITIYFFGSSVLRPSLTSLITQKVEKHRQGLVLGLTQSLMSIAQILAPLACGILIHHRWLTAWASTGALVAGIGAFLAYRPSALQPATPA